MVEPGTYQLDVRRTDASGAVFRDEADVAIGAVGPSGPAGIQGPQGSPGLSGFEVIQHNSTTTIGANTSAGLTAFCTSGKQALGGGCQLTPISGSRPYLTTSSRNPSGTGWHCRWQSPADAQVAEVELQLVATCATVP